MLGANTMQIILMLNKDFTILVGIAMLVAIPLAYFAAGYWLQSFPYKADLSVFIFILAGIVSLAISWITVSYQSYRASSINPVKSIAAE